MKKNIILEEYDQDWPKMFLEESEQIKKVLGSNVNAVHHIGSTSVPGMKAKPIIDMIAELKDSEKAIDSLIKLGYQYKGEYNIPMRRYFNKEGYNLHVYEEGHPEIELNLTFRDTLRKNPPAFSEYIRLKETLLSDPNSYEKGSLGFTGYNLGKDEFIRKILKQASFRSLRITKCLHGFELEAARKFRSLLNLDNSTFEEALKDSSQAHILLRQGIEAIGYGQISFPLNGEAHINILYAPEGYTPPFKEIIETWLIRFLKKSKIHIGSDDV